MVRLKTPSRFFIFSRRHHGICADYFKKKRKNVVKTSVDLSRQDEGDEMFGSSAVARSIVRSTMSASENIAQNIARQSETMGRQPF